MLRARDLSRLLARRLTPKTSILKPAASCTLDKGGYRRKLALTVYNFVLLTGFTKMPFNFRNFSLIFLSDTLDLYLDGTLPYSGKAAVTVYISPKFSLY